MLQQQRGSENPTSFLSPVVRIGKKQNWDKKSRTYTL